MKLLARYYRHVVNILEVSGNILTTLYKLLLPSVIIAGLADVDVRCASTYFRYGAALFYKAQDEQDVFGCSLQAATAHEDAEAVEDESSGKMLCVQLAVIHTMRLP